MADNLGEDPVLQDDGAEVLDEPSPPEAENPESPESPESRSRFHGFMEPLIRLLHRIWRPENRLAVAISLMMTVALFGSLWIFYRDHIKERYSLPGSEDYNAMMAVPMPPEGKPFFVYVSERRNLSRVSPDFYALFPGFPMDSMAVSLFPGEDGDVGFSSAVFCLDWKAMDEADRKKLISVQKGRILDLSFLFGSPGIIAKPQGDIDGIPMFSLEPDKLGHVAFSIYGNALLLSRSREDMISSIRALMHAMTWLSWNEGSPRVVRTFVEKDRRYRFFLFPERGNVAGLGLPRRLHQSLPQSVLFDMAFQRIDHDRSTEKYFMWLTRKEEISSHDAGFASDPISIRNCAGDVSFMRRKS